MCGRFNIIDDPFTQHLCQQLGLFDSHKLRFSDDVAPAAAISIIKQGQQHRQLVDATWWLLMHNQQGQLKPHYQYTSFNTRADKLNNRHSIAYQPYRESRCIIPASSFVEGQDKAYYQLQPQHRAIAFAGLYKTWWHPAGSHSNPHSHPSEVSYSAAIITLPGHPKLAHIHRKSLPLMLPMDDQAMIDAWLDPNFTDVAAFGSYLSPFLFDDLIATPVDKPSTKNPIGPSALIHTDRV